MIRVQFNLGFIRIGSRPAGAVPPAKGAQGRPGLDREELARLFARELGRKTPRSLH